MCNEATGSLSFEELPGIVINFAGKPARREVVNGREFLVAPITSIVTGVLNGSDGAIFYPESESSKNPEAWDGMPLVLHHPRNAAGIHVSARNPRVFAEHGLGHVYDSVWNGKLQHEGWFDVALVKAADKRFSTDVHGKLTRGEPMEMSTGLGMRKLPAPAGSQWEGQVYNIIASEYHPDHIAVLWNQQGACPLDRGCGVNPTVNEEAKGIVQRFFDWLTNNAGTFGNPQSKNTGKFKLHGAGTGKGAPHQAAQDGYHGGPKCACSNGETCDQCADDAPATATDEPTPITNSEGDDMDRKQLIAWLTTNCDCWKGKDKVLANVEAFTDDDLKKLKANQDKASADALVANEFKELSSAMTEEGQRMTVPQVARLVANHKALLTDNAGGSDPEGEAADSSTVDEGGKKKKGKVPPQFTKNQQVQIEEGLAKSMGFADVSHMRATLNVAKEVTQREKESLVRQLVANVAEDRKQATGDRLVKKSIEDLREMVSLLPVANAQQQAAPTVNWSGNGGGPGETNNGGWQLPENEQRNVMDLEADSQEFVANDLKSRNVNGHQKQLAGV